MGKIGDPSGNGICAIYFFANMFTSFRCPVPCQIPVVFYSKVAQEARLQLNSDIDALKDKLEAAAAIKKRNETIIQSQQQAILQLQQALRAQQKAVESILGEEGMAIHRLTPWCSNHGCLKKPSCVFSFKGMGTWVSTKFWNQGSAPSLGTKSGTSSTTHGNCAAPLFLCVPSLARLPVCRSGRQFPQHPKGDRGERRQPAARRRSPEPRRPWARRGRPAGWRRRPRGGGARAACGGFWLRLRALRWRGGGGGGDKGCWGWETPFSDWPKGKPREHNCVRILVCKEIST